MAFIIRFTAAIDKNADLAQHAQAHSTSACKRLAEAPDYAEASSKLDLT